MNKNNIEIIQNFLSNEENKTLLINPTSEEITYFYEGLLRNLSVNSNIKFHNAEYSKVNEVSNDLFGTKEIYLYFITNSKQIDEIEKLNFQKVIFTDYKNYKKFIKKYVCINGYDFEKDIKIFLQDHLSISDHSFIEHCISQPHLTFSEISKYNINNKNYKIGSPVTSEGNSIIEIRKDIFKLKRSKADIKKLFSKIKNEVKYKKFNFLTY